VLFGGQSGEHPISCVSAGGVLAALDPERYDVVPLGITRTGRWVRPPADQAYAIVERVLPEVTDGEDLPLPQGLTDLDVVFPVLHGAWGEDGTVQGLLELAGVPYVGSGVFASAAAMDKVHAKVIAEAHGLPVAPWVALPPGVPVPERLGLELPVFVKPARAGSSLGISRITAWDQLADAVAEARRHDPKVVVEQGVAGREIECGVLARPGGGCEASVPAEIRIVGGHDFYDFEAKYLDDATELDCPADLDDAVVDEVRRLARQAFSALDCAGLARVDFFLRPTGEVVLNEVNTMPGFTPVSMYPRMWAATGVAYPQLVDRLVECAIRSGTGLR